MLCGLYPHDWVSLLGSEIMKCIMFNIVCNKFCEKNNQVYLLEGL